MRMQVAPDVETLREYLSRHNGIRGIEILEPREIERAVRVFHRDGFVVVRDILTPEQTEFLRSGANEVIADILTLDPERSGNRGSHRYSFGESSLTRAMLHRPEWQMLIDLPTLTPIITALFGSSEYMVRSGGGDFCLPGAHGYQPLHSDMRDREEAGTPNSAFADRRGHLTTRDLPCPYICVNFMPTDSTRLNGPTRQILGTQHSREPFPSPDEEPEWMRLSTVCPAPAGSVQIRDVRTWHGGTPNVSEDVRAIPNIEYYAPWFREPVRPCISWEDRRKLSEHGQRLTRYVVAHSSEELVTGHVLGATPPRFVGVR